MDLSGACSTTVSRWEKQLLAEQRGEVVEGKAALNADKRSIQKLEN
jgi:hypothetical protein